MLKDVGQYIGVSYQTVDYVCKKRVENDAKDSRRNDGITYQIVVGERRSYGPESMVALVHTGFRLSESLTLE